MFEVWWVIHGSIYYKFTAEFAVETIFKTYEHLKLQASSA